MKFSLIIMLAAFLTQSCGFYHWPKVYRYNTIPYDIEQPLHKNVKQNKYNSKNPYYEEDTSKFSLPPQQPYSLNTKIALDQ